MKKIYLLPLALLAAMFFSCADWLDIQPELEIREKQMYETQSGFQDVLIGAYTAMATPELYGKNTTVMLPELMARHWTVRGNYLTGYVAAFDWEAADAKALLETVWLRYYQTIVNLNSLLENIDSRKDLFTSGNYELIKGEALGLRGFLHLEILRLWGDVPGRVVESAPAIPYVKNVTKNPAALVSATYRQVYDNILADLTAAEELLKDDPITLYYNSMLNAPGRAGSPGYESYGEPDDDFHFYRQNRFNIYAVKAAKARYYLWLGDKTEAARYAEQVIDALDPDGSAKFTLGTETDAGFGRLTFPSEHIFAVSNSQVQATLPQVFFRAGYDTFLTQNITYLRNAYEATEQTADIRFRENRLWEEKAPDVTNPTKYVYFKKYNQSGSETNAVEDMPLIRLSEMYFIAVEGGNTARFRDYRVARALNITMDDEMNDPDKVMPRLEKEYRKEFYGEGQMFFFYKRLGYTEFTWPTAYLMEANNYKLPQPESQTMFQ